MLRSDEPPRAASIAKTTTVNCQRRTENPARFMAASVGPRHGESRAEIRSAVGHHLGDLLQTGEHRDPRSLDEADGDRNPAGPPVLRRDRVHRSGPPAAL